MKLNPDCLRDVLLYAEEHAEEYEPWVVSNQIPAELLPYTFTEIEYHTRQCVAAGFLAMGSDFIDGSFEILSVAPAGYRAVEAVRNPSVHAKAKSEWPSLIAREIVSGTVSGFVSLAMGILQNAVPS